MRLIDADAPKENISNISVDIFMNHKCVYCGGRRVYCDGKCYKCVNTNSTTSTNADRIRTMTDADLAIFISEVKIDGLLRKFELPTSAIDWLEWLKQEAQDAAD